MSKFTVIPLYVFKETVDGWDRDISEMHLVPQDIAGVYSDSCGDTCFIYQGLQWTTPYSVEKLLRLVNKKTKEDEGEIRITLKLCQLN